MITTVDIGPFRVADVTYARAVEATVEMVVQGGRKRMYALHVGGLTHREDRRFVDEMRDAELVCADGGSVVLLGRLAGANSMERAPTTDLGWDVVRESSRRLARPVRVGLIGGPPGLAQRAAARLAAEASVEPVFTAHGYDQDWARTLDELRDAAPDLCFVGMGAPREMLWTREHLDRLPECPIVTCGGWFGFLAGEESRAPAPLRRSGLEWIARLVQDPMRLGPRYATGAWVTLVLAVKTARSRWRSD